MFYKNREGKRIPAFIKASVIQVNLSGQIPWKACFYPAWQLAYSELLCHQLSTGLGTTERTLIAVPFQACSPDKGGKNLNPVPLQNLGPGNFWRNSFQGANYLIVGVTAPY